MNTKKLLFASTSLTCCTAMAACISYLAYRDMISEPYWVEYTSGGPDNIKTAGPIYSSSVWISAKFWYKGLMLGIVFGLAMGLVFYIIGYSRMQNVTNNCQ